MTIITKPITEKKLDKSDFPLVNADNDNPKVDLEASVPSADDLHLLVLGRRARRVTTTTTLCLFITALMVMSIGVVGGIYLYRQYARAQMHRFRGWCNIPYESPKEPMYLTDIARDNQRDNLMGDNIMSDTELLRAMARQAEANLREDGFFKQKFDLDLDNDGVEKIDVPNFREGRRGRFIHDFNANKTGIIDVDGHRCFVMPLNRDMVLPPRSLFDLIHKMWDGYYEVNTEVVRETMRVVTPPLEDLSKLGPYISRECQGLPTYELEQYVSGVFKRSVPLEDNAKYGWFAGKNIVEIDIANLEEAKAYEANNLK